MANKSVAATIAFRFADEDAPSVADRKKIARRIDAFCSCFARRHSAAKWILRQFHQYFEISNVRELPQCRLRTALIILTALMRHGMDCSRHGQSQKITEAEAIAMGVLPDEWWEQRNIKTDKERADAKKILLNRAHTFVRGRPNLRLVYSRESV